jgi:hypothetical protein
MIDYYELEGRVVFPSTFEKWMTGGMKRVAASTHRHLWVSTMFCGAENCIFETMVFLLRRGRGDDASDLWCKRAVTWDEAIANHNEALNLCKTGQLTRGMKRTRSLKRGLKAMRKFIDKSGRKNEPKTAAPGASS